MAMMISFSVTGGNSSIPESHMKHLKPTTPASIMGEISCLFPGIIPFLVRQQNQHQQQQKQQKQQPQQPRCE